MIASNEIKVTYRQSTIHIVSQPQTVVIHWESALLSSKGQLEVSKANCPDGEAIRLVMETIDRCYKKYQRTKNQSRA